MIMTTTTKPKGSKEKVMNQSVYVLVFPLYKLFYISQAIFSTNVCTSRATINVP